ncbi:MAG: FAD-dependent oxidoreductase [Phenylobacterium sp.]|uniref:NAD(P)/FAD-dependent oxidoreductase n=1 Tax=Phenylobacterium sp. TaxID=1871053 RepID=UPI001A3C47A6|nr:FAD-dependent oxidoreductase [Phenylobacterium sp.]MBL8556129.1 FAD-dependent oxidoreductase [Phenylobacterium sp.]
MDRSPRVTVAGAGVLGWTTALALADAGCAVTICDPGGPNASSVAAGMIAPVFEAVLDDAARPHFDLLMAARDLWPGLAARAGIALDRSGAMAVGDDAWLDRIAAAFRGLGAPFSDVGRRTMDGLAPGLEPAFQRGLLTREDWRVDVKPALDALRTAALHAGVTHDATFVEARGGEDVLVVAAGYAPRLAKLAPEMAHLRPIKGHIVGFGDMAGGGVYVRSPWGYGIRSADGLTFGATMEVGRDDADPDPAVFGDLAAGAENVFRMGQSRAFTAAAGVRAATPDGLPLVGWSEAEPGVILAAGARRNGWLVAPLVAKIVAACVTGRDRGPYADRMDPARFRASLWD